ncbi:MAG: PilN domain-containing protein [Candidatus Zixiibacteriota bacterium]|nr:MAG: PilN domain-containing protein [candidate division Zixibacteria bacterium]
MIEVNLLPKGYLKGSGGLSLSKAGKYVAAGVGCLMVILASITFYQMYQLSELEENIERANRRGEALRQDIRMVDALINVKNKITLRMAAVEELDRHRSAWVRILEDIARNVPEFVWLGRFAETPLASEQGKGDSVVAASPANIRPAEVQGYCFTLNSLAAFMIKMMRSDYFDEVELVSATEVVFDEDGRVLRTRDPNAKGQKAYDFILTCNVHYLTEEELRNIVASTDQSVKSKTSATGHKQLN